MRVKIPKEVLYRRWVCEVMRSGFHNGARCTPDDPHGGRWQCAWYYERLLRLTEAQYNRRKYITVDTEA